MKIKNINIKKSLLALTLAICSNSIEPRKIDSQVLSNVDNCYKYVVRDNAAYKYYRSDSIYFSYDFNTDSLFKILVNGDLETSKNFEVYDLLTEEMLVFSMDTEGIINSKYYDYLFKENFVVSFKNISDLVEYHTDKDYYSMEEIKELEPLVLNSIKVIGDT